jgi:hypothetical protein
VALPRSALVAAAAWLAIAVALASSGLVLSFPPMVPLLLAGTVAACIISWRRSHALRRWTNALDLRWPILYHVVRIFFGGLFLIELAAGNLPSSFALHAGIGDIAAGLLAIAAAIAVGPRTHELTGGRRRLVWVFSILGLADILSVVVSAQIGILVLGDPLLLGAFAELPYPLLPTIIVPLVIVTHLLVIQRLRRQ